MVDMKTMTKTMCRMCRKPSEGGKTCVCVTPQIVLMRDWVFSTVGQAVECGLIITPSSPPPDARSSVTVGQIRAREV